MKAKITGSLRIGTLGPKLVCSIDVFRLPLFVALIACWITFMNLCMVVDLGSCEMLLKYKIFVMKDH